VIRVRGSAVALGVVLGLVLPLVVVFGKAQESGEPMPLVTALQASAVAAGIDVIIADVPDVQVYLSRTAGDWRRVLEGLASAYGLTLCELVPGTLLVTGAPGADRVCVVEPEPVSAPVVEPEPVVAPPPAPEVREHEEANGNGAEHYDIRLRVIEIAEQDGVSLGFDWQGGVFDTVAALVVGDYAAVARRLVSGEITAAIRFLESEGIGRRIDDLRVRAVPGIPALFRSGGDVTVNLVGAGNENISRTYGYGLSLSVTAGERSEGGVPLAVSIDASSPVNVSRPDLLTMSRRTVDSRVHLDCGEAVVLGSLFRLSEDYAGQGLPGVAEVPGLGFAFGTLGHNRSATSLVLTLELACAA
jgi:hypothetical protein